MEVETEGEIALEDPDIEEVFHAAVRGAKRDDGLEFFSDDRVA